MSDSTTKSLLDGVPIVNNTHCCKEDGFVESISNSLRKHVEPKFSCREAILREVRRLRSQADGLEKLAGEVDHLTPESAETLLKMYFKSFG